MPGFDGTGPMGGGPMTGRGMGFCAGRQPAGARRFAGRGRGFGFGRGWGGGFGWGRGFGWGAMPAQAGVDANVETAELAGMVADMRARLEQLESLLARRD